MKARRFSNQLRNPLLMLIMIFRTTFLQYDFIRYQSMAFTYDRRKFIKQGLRAGTIAGTGLSSVYPVFSMNRNKIRAIPYDLVAVRGGEPDMMFDKVIEALIGINTFLEKGRTVSIKPNIGWDAVSERAATTHPKMITRTIRPCFSTGACEYLCPVRLWKANNVKGNPQHFVAEKPV